MFDSKNKQRDIFQIGWKNIRSVIESENSFPIENQGTI